MTTEVTAIGQCGTCGAQVVGDTFPHPLPPRAAYETEQAWLIACKEQAEKDTLHPFATIPEHCLCGGSVTERWLAPED